jgi:hypothetical protein
MEAAIALAVIAPMPEICANFWLAALPDASADLQFQFTDLAFKLLQMGKQALHQLAQHDWQIIAGIFQNGGQTLG